VPFGPSRMEKELVERALAEELGETGRGLQTEGAICVDLWIVLSLTKAKSLWYASEGLAPFVH
jgi:hypothetical protein